MSTLRACATRSTGRSAGRRWRRCGASATGWRSAVSRGLSLRARLTLAFAAGMMVVSVGVGAFVYTQVRQDLRDEVDLGLRGRAQALVSPSALDHGLSSTSGHYADNDESFAQ